MNIKIGRKHMLGGGEASLQNLHSKAFICMPLVKTFITLLSIIYRVAKYLKGSKRPESDNQKGLLYTMQGFPVDTRSNLLFASSKFLCTFFMSVFSRLMKFLIS